MSQNTYKEKQSIILCMIDLRNPQYELRNGVSITLESVASLDGLVGIGDVHSINLSDAQYAMRIAEEFPRKRGLSKLLAEAVKKKRTAEVKPFAYKYDCTNDDAPSPAAQEDADLTFHFTYHRHPREGVVDVSYQEQSVSEIPFPHLKCGLGKMKEAYEQIRKELEYAQDWERDTELTTAWKQREPYLAVRFGWPEPIPDGLNFKAWSKANKKNWAPTLATADELGKKFYMLPDAVIVDRREFFRRPKIEQVSSS